MRSEHPGSPSEQHLAQLLAPVAALLADPEVSEIMINGPGTVYFERRGRLHRRAGGFGPGLMAAIRAMAQFVGKPVSDARPILEGRLPDGTRVEAVIPPAAPDGPIVSLRRFRVQKLQLSDLVSEGTLSEAAAHYLRARVAQGDNVIVSGGTGSGKTSLLNVLAAFIPEAQRIIVLEDARELQLQHPHVVQLESRPGDEDGVGAVRIRDLFHASLRLRPDRIVVGEIRGAEALDFVQAMTSGHGGGLSSIHASHPLDALYRLETCCMLADAPLGVTALRPRIASAVNLILQTSRSLDGRRRVTHITAVSGFGASGYRLSPRFELDDRDALCAHGTEAA